MSWDVYLIRTKNNTEPYDTVELQMRGIHNPIEVFAGLKKDLQARIFDMHGGKYIEDEQESGFEDWKNFTEKVINSVVTCNNEGK